jgi:hypothetical protein
MLLNAFTSMASGMYRSSSLEVSDLLSSSGMCPSRSRPSLHVSMAVYPASCAAGTWGKALTGAVITTMSPAAAASPLVAADASGPSSAAVSARVSAGG